LTVECSDEWNISLVVPNVDPCLPQRLVEFYPEIKCELDCGDAIIPMVHVLHGNYTSFKNNRNMLLHLNGINCFVKNGTMCHILCEREEVTRSLNSPDEDNFMHMKRSGHSFVK
jgi:hypothetical protein